MHMLVGFVQPIKLEHPTPAIKPEPYGRTGKKRLAKRASLAVPKRYQKYICNQPRMT